MPRGYEAADNSIVRDDNAKGSCRFLRVRPVEPDARFKPFFFPFPVIRVSVIRGLVVVGFSQFPRRGASLLAGAELAIPPPPQSKTVLLTCVRSFRLWTASRPENQILVKRPGERKTPAGGGFEALTGSTQGFRVWTPPATRVLPCSIPSVGSSAFVCPAC